MRTCHYLHKFENGQCVYCGEMDRKINFAKPQNVSKEWAKLFLEQWNRAVLLWDNGHMFRVHVDEYQPYQLRDQQEYASICCTWLIPNGLVEPHVLAHDMPEGCNCFHCILGL